MGALGRTLRKNCRTQVNALASEDRRLGNLLFEMKVGASGFSFRPEPWNRGPAPGHFFDPPAGLSEQAFLECARRCRRRLMAPALSADDYLAALRKVDLVLVASELENKALL